MLADVMCVLEGNQIDLETLSRLVNNGVFECKGVNYTTIKEVFVKAVKQAVLNWYEFNSKQVDFLVYKALERANDLHWFESVIMEVQDLCSIYETVNKLKSK